MFLAVLCLLCVVFLLLVLSFLALTCYIYYIHWKYSAIPQPKRPSFYLGHLPDLGAAGRDPPCVVNVYQQWLEQAKSPTFVVFYATLPMVITVDPESVKMIITLPNLKRNQSFMQNFKRIFGERLVENSIVTIEDSETWKARRQLYDPAFKKSYLKTLLVTFNEITSQLLSQFEPLADGVSKIPMKLHLGHFVMNAISKVGFGSNFAQKGFSVNSAQKEPTDQTKGSQSEDQQDGLHTLTSILNEGIGLQFRSPGIYKYLHPFKAAKYREAARKIRALGRDCIKERIQAIERGEQVPSDILTHILQMAATKESVDIEDLVDDFVIFYLAGEAPTQSLLTITLVLTLLHPHVLERLQSEVDEVLGSKNYVDAEDLEKLQYTEQVVKETLRLYQPFGFLFPWVTPPEGLTLNGYHIPGGAQLMLTSAAMCRMPEYFDDPETFNPSRFDPENKQPSSFIYFPFGVGQRSCIGRHFAMMEAKIVMSRLFQTYKINLPDNYKLVTVQKAAVITKDDVCCTLEKRLN